MDSINSWWDVGGRSDASSEKGQKTKEELLRSRYHILLYYLTAAFVHNKDMDMHAIHRFDVSQASNLGINPTKMVL